MRTTVTCSAPSWSSARPASPPVRRQAAQRPWRRRAPGRGGAAPGTARQFRPVLRMEGPIDDAIAHLKKHGIAVEAGPMQRFGAKGNGTSVYFRDPDGSLMEFISYHR